MRIAACCGVSAARRSNGFVSSRSQTIDWPRAAYDLRTNMAKARCQTESSRGRPTVGWANFAPRYLDSQGTDEFNVAVHEILHALGFSYDSFQRYRKQNGEVYAFGELFDRYTSGGRTITKLLLPTALDVARIAFDCLTLDGLELENDGGEPVDLRRQFFLRARLTF